MSGGLKPRASGHHVWVWCGAVRNPEVAAEGLCAAGPGRPLVSGGRGLLPRPPFLIETWAWSPVPSEVEEPRIFPVQRRRLSGGIVRAAELAPVKAEAEEKNGGGRRLEAD